jgi:hypothetical protein
MDFNGFLALQIKEIEKHRWIESERAGRDLSGIAELDWIQKHAKLFREHIERTYGPVDTRIKLSQPQESRLPA